MKFIFCPQCATNLQGKRICANCGADLTKHFALVEEEERKVVSEKSAGEADMALGKAVEAPVSPLRREGKYIYFGLYPQRAKAKEVSVNGAADENGYYTGSDGAKYAEAGGKYFKVEPIKWRILEERDGKAKILCDKIIAAKRYDTDKNNYKDSDIRKWLNGEFYNTAFGDSDKKRIVTTEVDNGLASTGDDVNPYTCENTNDAVFLLSYQEAFESYGLTDADRKRRVTPYAKKAGVYVYGGNNCGWWWLRSPCNDGNNEVCGVFSYGDYFLFYVYYDDYGVVPALQIKL